MITEVDYYEKGLKQPSAYKARIRVLKIEEESIDAIKAIHMSA